MKRRGLLADVRAERTAAAGSVILVSRFAATAVLNYVVGLALAWLLTPAAFGLVSAVQNVLLLSAGLLTAGLPWALALRIAQTHGVPAASRPEFRTTLVVNFGFGVALGAGFLGMQLFAVELVPSQSLILILAVAAEMPVLAVNATLAGAAQGSSRFGGPWSDADDGKPGQSRSRRVHGQRPARRPDRRRAELPDRDGRIRAGRRQRQAGGCCPGGGRWPVWVSCAPQPPSGSHPPR